MRTRLAIWVEGDTDRWFIEAVVKPRLESRYAEVVANNYRQTQTPVVNRKLRAMAHQGFDRLFLADIDSAPCVTSRKLKIRERYRDLKDQEIIIVSKEIESWYLAGLSLEGATALNLNPPASTDQMAKLDVVRLGPSRFESQLDFLLELLKYFDPATACRRNRSFAYFHRMLP